MVGFPEHRGVGLSVERPVRHSAGCCNQRRTFLRLLCPDSAGAYLRELSGQKSSGSQYLCIQGGSAVAVNPVYGGAAAYRWLCLAGDGLPGGGLDSPSFRIGGGDREVGNHVTR